MYQKILAPLDGSEFSECALAHVSAIATGCQVPDVTLLSIIEPVPQMTYVYASDVLDKAAPKMQAETENYLGKIADRLKGEGLTVQTVVLNGRAADEILSYISQNPVDLIIMSTHGRAGVSRWVMGSVTDRVLRHSTVPVLTVSPAGCRVSL